MLLKQLSTSSSSSSGTYNDNQENFSQARVENPSPPTLPPQTSAATPLPEVDEEAQRRLTRILRSFSSGEDIATIYAAVKAQMGVTLSKDKDVASTSQNPTTTAQAKTPLRTTEPTPAVSLVYYSDDDSEENGAQPAPVPTGAAESLPPPHAESTSALYTPIQPVEVVNLDDDYVEDLPLPPNEMLQQKESEWNFIQNVEDESVPDREDEPLRHRTRRIEVNPVEVGATAVNRQGAKQAVRSHRVRSILDEPNEPEGYGASEAMEKRTTVTDSHQRIEQGRKRKRKRSVPPPPKRIHPASRDIVITNADQPAPPQQGVESDDTKEREFRLARTSRRQQGRSATPPAAENARQSVVLTTDLL